MIICDVSPPRGSSPGPLVESASIDADFFSVAYNPGQSVRVNSAFVARYMLDCIGRPAVFTLATRDMNRIAIQSLLLGASWAGLHNVVVVRGDPIRDRERPHVKTVNDYTTTELLTDISRMNRGIDFRGLSLADLTSFCPGAAVDLSKGVEDEASLALRKVAAGAEFFLSQAHFSPSDILDFQRILSTVIGECPPLFAGVQVLARDGIDFGNVPDRVRSELAGGMSGLAIAKQLASELWSLGIKAFYVIPAIRPRGLRDYSSAAELVRYIRSLPVP